MRCKKLRGNYGKLFFTIFISCIAISVIPILILFSIVNNFVLHDYQEKVLETYQYRLMFVKRKTDSFFLELNRSATQISLNRDFVYLNSILSQRNIQNPEDVMKVISVRHMLEDISVSNSQLNSMYLYYPQYKRILSSSSLTYAEESLTQKWLSKYDFLNKNLNCFIGEPDVTTGNRSMIFLSPVSNYLSQNEAAFIAEINPVTFLDYVLEGQNELSSNLFIFNKNGELLIDGGFRDTQLDLDTIYSIYQNVSASKEKEILTIGGKKYLITYVKSDYFGFTYMSISNTELFKGIVNQHKAMIIVVVGGLIIFSIVISYRIAKKIYNPVKDIINILPNLGNRTFLRKSSENELMIIAENIQNFICEERTLSGKLDQYENRLQKSYIFNCMMGNKPDEYECDYPNGDYIAIVVSIDNYKEFESQYSHSELYTIKFFVAQTCESVIIDKSFGVCYIMSENKIVMAMIASDSTNWKDIIAINCRNIQNLLKEQLIETSFGVGENYELIDNIHISYSEALEAAEYHSIFGLGSIVFYSQVANRQKKYYYSCMLEKRLFNAFDIKNEKDVYDKINQFFNDIAENNDLHYQMIFNACYKICSNSMDHLLKANISMNSLFGLDFSINKTLAKFTTIYDYKEFLFTLFKKAFQYLCQDQNVLTHTDQIIAYIRENYNQSDMSINKVCDQFGISYSLMKKVLNNELDSNFVDYLNRLRIDEAKVLLHSTDVTNNEIAQRIGYNNDLSFIRNFKKYEGITSSEYRRIISQAKGN